MFGNYRSHSTDQFTQQRPSISITTYDSDTFSELDAEREARIRSLQEQEIVQGIRIAQLEAALAAMQLQLAGQTQGDRATEVEVVARQVAEERHLREVAEQVANEAREASARSEALRLAAEQQLLVQQQQEIAQGIRIAQLEAALAAMELQLVGQTQRDRVTEVEVAARQVAEERHMREVAEQVANEAREASSRSEALRLAAEQQLLAQQQLEIQRQAERQRVAEEAARQAALQLPINQQP